MEGDTMNHSPDNTTTAGNGGNFDPRQAAVLLEQTTQQARRRIQPYPPWLLVIRGVGALAVFGAVWLSVRGQHPYKYPTSSVVPFAIAFGVVNLVATVAVARRATAGVSGRSRLRPGELVILTVASLGVFVILAVLAGAGVSDRIVYGTYPATVPLMVAGVAWAAVMGARANWRSCGSGIAIAVVGVVGAFAGPAGAWAVAGVGICLELLGTAAIIAWQQRRSVVRP
jgi:hypothetical protein